MSATLYATTKRNHTGLGVISGRFVVVPAGTEVRIPSRQVESGRSYYDAKARVDGRTVSVQVRPECIDY